MEVLTVLFALTNETFRPAGQAVVAELVPPDKTRGAFALIRLAVNIGMSVGPVLGGILATFSYRYLFIVDGITTLLGVAILILSGFRAACEPARASRAVESIKMKPFAHALGNRGFLLFLLAIFPTAVVFFQSNSTMPIYVVRELGFSEATFGWLCAVNTVIIILLEIQLTSWISHWPYRRTLSLGALLFGIGFGSMVLAHDRLTLALTVVIWTFGEMIFFPSLSAYVAELAPARQRGEYMGLFGMSFSLAFALGPWLGMFTLERYGSSVLWTATFVVGVLSAAALALMLRRRSGT